MVETLVGVCVREREREVRGERSKRSMVLGVEGYILQG